MKSIMKIKIVYRRRLINTHTPQRFEISNIRIYDYFSIKIPRVFSQVQGRTDNEAKAYCNLDSSLDKNSTETTYLFHVTDTRHSRRRSRIPFRSINKTLINIQAVYKLN